MRRRWHLPKSLSVRSAVSRAFSETLINEAVCSSSSRLTAAQTRSPVTLGEYDGVVTRTAKRRVTEVRLTPAAPAEDAEKDDEKDKRFSRIAQRGESR